MTPIHDLPDCGRGLSAGCIGTALLYLLAGICILGIML